MSTIDDDTVLMTIRVRRDVDFPSRHFISLRRYAIARSLEPERTANVATVDEAVELTRAWLKNLQIRS